MVFANLSKIQPKTNGITAKRQADKFPLCRFSEIIFRKQPISLEAPYFTVFLTNIFVGNDA